MSSCLNDLEKIIAEDISKIKDEEKKIIRIDDIIDKLTSNMMNLMEIRDSLKGEATHDSEIHRELRELQEGTTRQSPVMTEVLRQRVIDDTIETCSESTERSIPDICDNEDLWKRMVEAREKFQ